jgi:hypothetical protein
MPDLRFVFFAARRKPPPTSWSRAAPAGGHRVGTKALMATRFDPSRHQVLPIFKRSRETPFSASPIRPLHRAPASWPMKIRL